MTDDFDLSRRALAGSAAFALLLGAAPRPAAANPETLPPAHDMSALPPTWRGSERIAFLLYPGFTALDLFGPHYMLASLIGAQVHLVAKTRDPVVSDQGVAVLPTATFADCPDELDVLCLPGGTTGTLAAMRDPATLGFVKHRGRAARIAASVCTGSLILGAAGLLEGRRATSHWLTLSLLPMFGATPERARLVRDGPCATGGGVTAGIDFGLALIAELRDRAYAEAVQLLAEYAPAPPFSAGDPETAPPAARALLEGMFVGFGAEARATAKAAMELGRTL